jgi:hypothetical protein
MENNNDSVELKSNSKRACIKVDLAILTLDPCLRKKVYDYHSSDRDQIRRVYQQKGPSQLANHIFSQTQFTKNMASF